MAKEMLKVGDLVQWGVPGVDKTPIHAMVIEHMEVHLGAEGKSIWIAIRGDGTKWSAMRCTGTGQISSRGTWWSVNRTDVSSKVVVGGILV